MSKKVVIIGNGISGITAARHIRKSSDMQISVISAETDYFFSRTALMYVYMGHMKFEDTKPYEDWFWKKNKIDLVKANVEEIEVASKSIFFSNGNSMSYDYLLLATGSRPNFFGWPGQDLAGVQGLYSYPDLVRMEENTKGIKEAVIIGGGLIGVEMAEMLHSRGIKVTMLVRESHYWGNVLPKPEGELINRHLVEKGVVLCLDTELKEIIGDKGDRVEAILDSRGNRVSCQFLGISTGVRPNIDFLKDSGIELDRGVLVDAYLETNVKGVFALGDCAQHREAPVGRERIEQVWYTGRKMGEMVAKTLTGIRTAYQPGPWFNSAKFFDIEYQTYGKVRNLLHESESEYYWESSEGDKCMHFVMNSKSGIFLGVNSFGIRLRHEVFDKWIREEKSLDFVIRHLKEANFDPEFFKRYETEIEANYQQYISKLSA